MQGLMLHAGANKVELKDVEAVITPQPSFRGEKGKRMFYPIPHTTLIRSVSEGLGRQGYSVTEQTHALVKDGARYFGVMKVRHESERAMNDYTTVIGLRNGHDGSFNAALAVGASVFVCDNLSFSGEVEVGRKHTRFIMRDLPGMIFNAIGRLGAQRQAQAVRFETYKRHELREEQAHSLILRSLTTGVIGEHKVRGVLEQWETPPHEEFKARTVWSLFNAFTEIFKPAQRKNDSGDLIVAPTNLGQLGSRTMKLHGLLDSFVGLSV